MHNTVTSTSCEHPTIEDFICQKCGVRVGGDFTAGSKPPGDPLDEAAARRLLTEFFTSARREVHSTAVGYSSGGYQTNIADAMFEMAAAMKSLSYQLARVLDKKKW